MKLRNWSLLRPTAIASALLLFGCIALLRYHAPMQVETIDSLAYCACGYSTVSFNDGKIRMINYHHNTVKSGEQIGTYRVMGKKVDIEIIFNGEVHQHTFAVDNVGLLTSDQFPLQYYALNSKSPKTYIHFAIQKTWLRLKQLTESLISLVEGDNAEPSSRIKL